MCDSTDLYDEKDWAGLARRLREDGFIFVRGVLPREKVEAARCTMLQHACTLGLLDASKPLDSATMAHAKRSCSFTVDAETGLGPDESSAEFLSQQHQVLWQTLGCSAPVTGVYRSPALFDLYAHLFGVGAFTPLTHCTWLRFKSPADVTLAHSDFYHFAKNDDLVHTLHSPSTFHKQQQVN